ncbi:hypothetical protein IP87_06390 [beta proteobacterium AAP121]|nr:hypothetical protein IP80_13760 [beta proteobacterium AAP65]KPF99201.1 hypothetical protein IP87_06390 [beta proteobacterium AAP121]
MVQAHPAERLKPAAAHRGWLWLAAVAALALLLSYGRAVQLVQTQGADRRAATLQRAQALWLCSSMAGERARRECRAKLP